MARYHANMDLYDEVRPIVERAADLSHRAAARELEAAGVLTPRVSASWSPTAVKRLRAVLT